MDVAGLAARAASTILTGVTGVAVVEGVRRATRGGGVHRAAVAVTAAGMRGARVTESGAERVRLGAADIVAEARERNGEQAPPPATGTDGHDHEH